MLIELEDFRIFYLPDFQTVDDVFFSKRDFQNIKRVSCRKNFKHLCNILKIDLYLELHMVVNKA